MYFTEPPAGEVVVAETASPFTTVAITIGTLVTLVLGVLPAQVLDLAERSSQFSVEMTQVGEVNPVWMTRTAT